MKQRDKSTTPLSSEPLSSEPLSSQPLSSQPTSSQPMPSNCVTAVRLRRGLRWLDSLMWLVIAGALTAMLIPAPSKQTASKFSGHDSVNETAKANETKSVPYIYDSIQYFPAGPEFNLQSQADYVRSPEPPAAGDNSPRVTSGPKLIGPELGDPARR